MSGPASRESDATRERPVAPVVDRGGQIDRAHRHRVLHLLGNFNSGGSERQAVDAARLLAASGRFDVRFACLDRTGPLLEAVEEFGASEPEEFPIESFARPGTIAQCVRFARFLRRERIELVHCHEFYGNVFGLFGAALAGTRARIGSRRNTGGTRTATPGRRRLERAAFRTAHAVVANGAAVRESLAAEGTDRGKIEVVPNAVDAERFETAASVPAGAAAPRVTSVANMRHPVKDQATLLRAAAIVLRTRPDAEFVLAGEGELLPRYRALAEELGIGARVRFPGRIDAVEALLADSRVCVLSSAAEGMSNALLEYAAAGRPIVTTDVGAAREIVLDGESGVVVPPADPEALAEAIEALLADGERATRFGRRGREHVETRFSRRVLLERLVGLYERLLHGAGP